MLGKALQYGLQMACQPPCPYAFSCKKGWASHRPSGVHGLDGVHSPALWQRLWQIRLCVCSMPSHGARLAYKHSLNRNVQTIAQFLCPGWASTRSTTNATAMAQRTGTVTSHGTAEGTPMVPILHVLVYSFTVFPGAF